MEELLQKINYYCKPITGLRMKCKLFSGRVTLRSANANVQPLRGRLSLYKIIFYQRLTPTESFIGNKKNKKPFLLSNFQLPFRFPQP